MKKALSVLLVVAALFGFYGSAVTVNDLLACKDYWEEAGEKSTADMNKLEDGLNQLKDNEQAYLDGVQQVADGEVALADGEAQYAQGLADYAAAPGKLAAGKAAIASGQKEYDEGLNTYNSSKEKLDTLEENINLLENGIDLWASKYSQADAAVDTFASHGLIGEDGKLSEDALAAYISEMENGAAASLKNQLINGMAKAAYQAQNQVTDEQWAAMSQQEQANAIAAYAGYATGQVNQIAAANGIEFIGETVISDINKLIAFAGTEQGAALSSFVPTFKASKAKLESLEAMPGLITNRKTIETSINTLLGEVTKDPANLKKLGGSTALAQVKAGLSGPDATFAPTVKGLISKARDLIKDGRAQLAAGKKKLAAGKKKLDAGKAQYKQGLADYAAAPGKLSDAEQQLADGRAQLADGKSQLAQYEDGEQQIRDGLATLFNTEADLELESIANRLNGDGDFDNGDNHLEIDEGLNAVEVGRGYQAEDGVLITNEIMGRAVATGGLIGAAVLAVLAAILSFLNKNKGAAVFALLAAAAGAFGAFYGPAQGTYFSDIAGSTIGTLTWVAAGVLGAVALVHAIVHFAAPKNA